MPISHHHPEHNFDVVNWSFHTVDGRNPAPVDMVYIYRYLQGFIHVRWCKISSVNSSGACFEPSLPSLMLMPKIPRPTTWEMCQNPISNGTNPQLVTLPDFWLPSTTITSGGWPAADSAEVPYDGVPTQAQCPWDNNQPGQAGLWIFHLPSGPDI